jgi:hypothetical protein
MPAEIVLFVLGGLTLVGVLAMDALGALGVFGALRFTTCSQCDRWTVHGLKATHLVCHRCRRHEHREGVAIGARHGRWLHFGD